MKVAAIQMVSAIAREANLARAHDLLARAAAEGAELAVLPEYLSLIHISEPTRPLYISYAVFCLKKKKSCLI